MTQRTTRTATTVACLLALTALTGCSRVFYRQQADAQAYHLVDGFADNRCWRLDDYTIEPDPRSRFYSPYCPDFPPQPPDDPAAHRLMECVDCKRGWPCWKCYGRTCNVESPCWRSYLPLNEKETLVLDMPAAVQTARINSRDYQSQLETLYLSALDVSFEQFRFDKQFFAGQDASLDFRGRDASGRVNGAGERVASTLLTLSPLDPGNRLRMEQLFADGGTLVVGLANSLMWEFSSSDSDAATTLLDFTFVQPLLRGAGRARVLERLTISERQLLANVRQMVRFRRGFYADVVAGIDAGPGPSRRGGVLGTGLQGFTGIGGGGFGGLGGTGGGATSGGAGAAQAGGYLGLLQDQQEIRNQESNVVALRDSLAQLDAAHEAGRIDRFQVDLARQALYNAQSRLLTSKNGYQGSLDSFKIQLGLPPDLEVEVADPLLDRFKLLAPELVALRNRVSDQLDALRSEEETAPPTPRGAVAAAIRLQHEAESYLDVVRRDYARLEANLPARRAALKRLSGRPEVSAGDIDASLLSVEQLDGRVKRLTRDFDGIVKQLAENWPDLERLESAGDADSERREQSLTDYLTRLSGQLLELTLVQARIRLDTVSLAELEMEPATALEIAKEQRLDLMNARAQLVDSWRLIEFNANDLLAGLDLSIAGDVGNAGNNPLDFRSSRGSLRVGVAFDDPITRLAERNVYRQSLIEYQQARRQFYALIDRVDQGLRSILRTVRLDELNFELRRKAVQVAITQVDLARLRLTEPPKPGATTEFGATTARDLVQALSDLLNVQNDFLSVWVNFEVQRLALDFNLGTMRLDPTGMWIDPQGSRGRLGNTEPAPIDFDAFCPADAPPVVDGDFGSVLVPPLPDGAGPPLEGPPAADFSAPSDIPPPPGLAPPGDGPGGLEPTPSGDAAPLPPGALLPRHVPPRAGLNRGDGPLVWRPNRAS